MDRVHRTDQSFKVAWSNHSASAHERAPSCVLHPSNCPGPTTLLLLVQGHCSVCFNHLTSIGTSPLHMHMQGHSPLCSDSLIAPGPTTPLCICRSTIPMFPTYLMSPAPTTVLQHMQEHCPVCSDHLFFPGPMTLLLLI
jgi:hypothetical protein